MSASQLLVFGIIIITLILFVWNKWRYDIVAVSALLVLTVAGFVPADQAFKGLGHPAVVTVASVLIISRALINSGLVDSLSRKLVRTGGSRPWKQVAILTGIVALCSGFMNNIGALSLFMPVGIWMSRKSGYSPSIMLMPLAFGSLLGGLLTLIGTPPNIIIAAYRAETAAAAPFGMFDFLPVGGIIAICGVLFISLIGWRLTPPRVKQDSPEELFKTGVYITEVIVDEKCKFSGQTLYNLFSAVKDAADIILVAMIRDKKFIEMPPMHKVLKNEDVLLIESDSESLQALLDITCLKLAADTDWKREGNEITEKQLTLIEAIVAPESILTGKTPIELSLRAGWGINIIAVARQGQKLKQQLGKIRFAIGDILLVQGNNETLPSNLNELGCFPLAHRGLRIGQPRKIWTAFLIFAIALAAAAFKLLPAGPALAGGAVFMVVFGLIKPGEIYKSIDMPVIILLGALIPIGGALENVGGPELIAGWLLGISHQAPVAVIIAVFMCAVILLSNIINNAAAAVFAAPVAISIADNLGVCADPFLMAAGIAASCAFLTPIGHQSNIMVMAPGGYRFGDYWRMGLPLTILVIGCAVPAILWIWPLR